MKCILSALSSFFGKRNTSNAHPHDAPQSQNNFTQPAYVAALAPGETVILREETSANDSRYLAAKLTENGDLKIEGQDLGDAVEDIFGYREYEWIWTVPAAELPKLTAALQAKDGLLIALQEKFYGEEAGKLGPFLTEHDIHYESWSRVGD